jgi:carboxylesterase
MTALNGLLEILSLWLAANALHALWIGARRRGWERTFARDAAGVREGAQAYTAGAGPIALLWIPGFSDPPAMLRRLAQRLADTGRFTCRVMRLPGAGEPTRAAARQSLDDWRAAVRREVAALRRDHARVWVAGHSLGAGLALLTALEAGAGVDGVVAITPLLRISRRRAPVLSPGAWFALARVVFALSPTFENCFAPTAVADDDPSFRVSRDRFIAFATYRNLFALTAALAPQAERLRTPLLAVLAAEDRVVDTPAVQRWCERVTAPKMVRLLPQTGHLVTLAPGWERVADDIAAFCAGPA